MPSILKVDTIQESTTSNGVVFSHPVELPNGTAAAPGLAFSSDTNSGLYRISEDKIGVAVNGARVGEVGTGYGGFTGNVIQVVQASDGTGQTFASGSQNNTTFYDVSGLSLSITPKYTSSKILLIASVGVGQYGDGYNAFLRFVRGSTAIGSSDSVSTGLSSHATFRAFNDAVYTNIAMSWLDSPNTTSSTTYKIQICNSGGSSFPSYINRPRGISSWMFGITSVLTAMEIQQ